ncbi:MAG: glycerol-3-phosphate responsive antiterminator, partial [Clostridia bacterium]|nr:glycerol-3-phosphate responsive antiterminator [Clostridia bacterium]
MNSKIFDSLEASPVIAAVRDENFAEALASPVDMIILFHSHILTVQERVKSAHEKGKILFIHIDLADGIARDRAGVAFLSRIGVDGVISTKPSLLRVAKEMGLVTVQRFFVYDSQGVAGIEEVLA